MKLAYLSCCVALLMVTTAMAEDTPKSLFDFTGADAAKEWQAVNDGVMGGVSEGTFRMTDTQTLEFFGTLSLALNYKPTEWINVSLDALNLNNPTLTYYQSATAPTAFYNNGAQYYLNLRFKF